MVINIYSDLGRTVAHLVPTYVSCAPRLNEQRLEDTLGEIIHLDRCPYACYKHVAPTGLRPEPPPETARMHKL